MKQKTVKETMKLLSIALVIAGILVMLWGLHTDSKIWENIGTELFGGGIFMFALYLFTKIKKIFR